MMTKYHMGCTNRCFDPLRFDGRDNATAVSWTSPYPVGNSLLLNMENMTPI